MKKKIIDVKSDDQSTVIRAVNGIFIVQENWLTKKKGKNKNRIK